MAFVLAILAVLAVASPLNAYELPSTGSGQLAKDFQKMIDLIPMDEVLDITRAYQAQDAQFQSMMKLLTVPESKKFVLDVEAADAIKNILAYVQENGLDIYYLVNKFNKALQLPPYKPLAAPKRRITGGLSGFTQDILRVIPTADLVNILNDRKENSAPFAELVNFLSSSEFLEFVETVIENESYLNLKKMAEGFGVDPFDFITYYSLLLTLAPILEYAH